jgi:hypothetical protein
MVLWKAGFVAIWKICTGLFSTYFEKLGSGFKTTHKCVLPQARLAAKGGTRVHVFVLLKTVSTFYMQLHDFKNTNPIFQMTIIQAVTQDSWGPWGPKVHTVFECCRYKLRCYTRPALCQGFHLNMQMHTSKKSRGCLATFNSDGLLDSLIWTWHDPP